MCYADPFAFYLPRKSREPVPLYIRPLQFRNNKIWNSRGNPDPISSTRFRASNPRPDRLIPFLRIIGIIALLLQLFRPQIFKHFYIYIYVSFISIRFFISVVLGSLKLCIYIKNYLFIDRFSRYLFRYIVISIENFFLLFSKFLQDVSSISIKKLFSSFDSFTSIGSMLGLLSIVSLLRQC